MQYRVKLEWFNRAKVSQNLTLLGFLAAETGQDQHLKFFLKAITYFTVFFDKKHIKSSQANICEGTL